MTLSEQNERCTFADYLTWNKNYRAEIIHGECIRQKSSLAVKQKAATVIAVQMFLNLIDKHFKVCPDPGAVRLFAKEGDSPYEIDTVVTPDIIAVSDYNKIDIFGCIGVPDVVIEITSFGSRKYNHITKYELYQSAGVQEYWMVNPIERIIEVNILKEDGHFHPSEFYTDKDETAIIKTLDNCSVSLDLLFH